MPTTLPPILLNSPLVDSRTLRLTSPWLHWFELSYVRQGGQEAATNTELAGGVQDNSDHIGQVEDSLGETNTTVAEVDADLKALTTRVTTLEGQVSTLETQVETLAELVEAQSVRLTALEAWRTALVAALPAVVTVATVPALANDPATAILLENDLTANWRSPLNANDSGLATAVNAVRNALAA
jgi:septal ring factor EnvC (AmiA/AmiB activator)